ncbi:MAG: purine-nucleoside phosphorylase [Saprospiraceae bacterium]|nr:purine-nucleoside phosphorylase [Saprospiraceae bacterium]
MQLYNQIQEAVDYINNFVAFDAKIGIILGTGLGSLTDDLLIAYELDYTDIPHFPVSTVKSHKGKLIFGYLEGKAVVVMAGRFHYYEGYSMQQVTFPVRVLKFLGIETLLITNVAGSTNTDIEAGDIVFVRDHVNLQPENPLRGENDERLGVRFPDMLDTYDKKLIQRGLRIAEKHRIRATSGVYVALQGPNLETPAEYTFINRIGGDLVGMSTVPEVLVARHSGLRLLVLSVVSNKCFPVEDIRPTTLESVIAVAAKAEMKMRTIVKELIKNDI